MELVDVLVLVEVDELVLEVDVVAAVWGIKLKSTNPVEIWAVKSLS